MLTNQGLAQRGEARIQSFMQCDQLPDHNNASRGYELLCLEADEVHTRGKRPSSVVTIPSHRMSTGGALLVDKCAHQTSLSIEDLQLDGRRLMKIEPNRGMGRERIRLVLVECKRHGQRDLVRSVRSETIVVGTGASGLPLPGSTSSASATVGHRAAGGIQRVVEDLDPSTGASSTAPDSIAPVSTSDGEHTVDHDISTPNENAASATAARGPIIVHRGFSIRGYDSFNRYLLSIQKDATASVPPRTRIRATCTRTTTRTFQDLRGECTSIWGTTGTTVTAVATPTAIACARTGVILRGAYSWPFVLSEASRVGNDVSQNDDVRSMELEATRRSGSVVGRDIQCPAGGDHD